MKRTDPNKRILKRLHIDLHPGDDDNANDDGGVIVDNTRYCPSSLP